MFLAVKELIHSKTKFLLFAVIIVLISWLVFILNGLGNGLSTLAAASFKNMKADYVIFEQGSRASMSRSLLSEDLVAKAEQLPGVEAAAPMGSTMATALKNENAKNEDKVDIAILGIIPGSFLEPAVREGEGLSDGNPYGVIVNDTLKDYGFGLGDSFLLEGTDIRLTIAGFVENETYNHVASVFTPLEIWREITFAAPGSDRGIQGPVNAIMLQGRNLDPAVIDHALENTETVTRQKAVQGLPGYKEEAGTIMMMLAFLMAISAFVIGVFFYVLTLQKTNQFGIMKAIGAQNGFLRRAVISQVFVLSLISIAAGVLLTYGTAAIIPDGMPFKLEFRTVVLYAVILLLIAVLSSWISVRRISKIDPLIALGKVE
jgi:putative ABC transport system permease protein